MAIVINGSGTVTGLAVGGLPDATVDAGTLASGINKTSITDGGNATAITIDSNENVGIGVTPESTQSQYYKTLDVASGASFYGHTTVTNRAYFGANQYLHSSGVQKYKATSTASLHEMDSGTHKFKVAASGSADADITWTNALEITNDGRGLSQFTAKAWVNFNGEGTVAMRDSHNVSSITDSGTGLYKVNFANNMANANYMCCSMGKDARIPSFGDAISVPTVSLFQIKMQRSWDAAASDNEIICVATFGD
tara:strand:- start:266 stop:1021 length:756 start_codon:yes stop_codon:yes gene_type:complete